MRIACWSGPRNVSTALMRSFEARGDCEVVDEPLYAAYLAATGKDHPGRDEILRSQPTDPHVVLERLREPPRALRFEKHMAHHWLGEGLGWPWDELGPARHVLLIRDPVRVVASYARIRERPLPEDLGYVQQLALRDHLRSLGEPIIAIDGDELVADAPRMLRLLCDALGIAFTDRMLRWEPGRRPTDGVWAPWWYAAVEASTGFRAPRSAPEAIPEGHDLLVSALEPAYRSLAADRLR